jgi:hypothetical protein
MRRAHLVDPAANAKPAEYGFWLAQSFMLSNVGVPGPHAWIRRI